MPDIINEIPPEGLKATRTVTSGDQTIRLGFVWHGGTYIDVCRVLDSPSGGAGKWCTPIEVINVWDYAKNESRIPRTSGAFGRRVNDWINDYGHNALVHDVTQNWSVLS